jgi:hypothetical protein
MTKLEAVNEILEALGEPPVNALDTGGDSIVAEAESTLDSEGRRVQNRGWYINTEQRRTLYRADTNLTVSGVSGTFSFEETVTGGTSGNTATLLYAPDGTTLMVHDKSGDFSNGETLTGGNSGATATFSSSATVSESKIAIDSSWLHVERGRNEVTRFAVRGNFLYWPDQENRHDEADGFLHNDDVEALIIKHLDFTDLTDALQDYVTKMAAVKFQRFKKRGEVDDQIARAEAERAQIRARQEDTDLRGVNTLDTPEMQRLKGDRHKRPSAHRS